MSEVILVFLGGLSLGVILGVSLAGFRRSLSYLKKTRDEYEVDRALFREAIHTAIDKGRAVKIIERR